MSAAEIGADAHQAHAGKLGAFGYRFACLVNRVEIQTRWLPVLRLPKHRCGSDRAGWSRERGIVRRLTGRPFAGGIDSGRRRWR